MFSIIIPLYNKAHTIINTLNTVFNQTCQDFEIIIVNDGSTDNSLQLIRQNFNDKRIKIINQENAGVSAARNKGIQESQGDWISFLDGDDEWLPDYLKETQKAIRDYPKATIIMTGRYVQNYASHKRYSNIPTKHLNKISEINYFENPHVYSHISATTVKTSILKQYFESWGRFIEGQKSNEDFTFLYRIALHEQVVYIGKALSIYNGNVSNQTTSTIKDQKVLEDYVLFNNTVINEYRNINKKNKTFEIFMKYAFRHNILRYLKERKYENIKYILTNLTNSSLNILTYTFEYRLFLTQTLNKLAISYILLTKLVWRTHKYPRIK